MKYLFEHGHSPHLASKELVSLLASQKVKYKKLSSPDNLTIIDTKSDLDLVNMVDVLGGTIRAAQLFRRISNDKIENHLDLSIESVAKEISKSNSNKRITFAISDLSKTLDTRSISLSLKKALVDLGHSVRFVESNSGNMLQPIVWNSETLELIFVFDKSVKQWDVYLTQNVTNVRSWQKRDRNRPQVDAQSGVLPPKVARMMINLGRHAHQNLPLKLWDPFCGSGTVIMEAMFLGIESFGSDISTQAIADSQQNLDWVKTEFDLATNFSLANVDSSQIQPSDLNWGQMDLIVGEGYLGPAMFSFEQIPSIMEELLILYQKSISNFKNWLKPTGRIVLALPFFSHPQNPDFQKKLIDTCQDSGYNLTVSPLIYGQPKARVKRAIFILENN